MCNVLGFWNTNDGTKYLDDDEKASIDPNTINYRLGLERVLNTETIGKEVRTVIPEGGKGGRPLTIINESGLYSLILRSRKPEAKGFRKWVTGTVLPAIRKTEGIWEANKP